MSQIDKQMGECIHRLINKKNLSRPETRDAFYRILRNETTEMQQGAFLAALTAKGETAEEVAGAWDAIYDLDTEKVRIEGDAPVVENSGTGMDTFKTFNISTAASIIAAAGGVKMARHGARAITSMCGTVDMAEALGVDVDCGPELVVDSIYKSNIGLFNGMSPKIHPNALGRILSKICFGSTLNIAGSLANPALPRQGVRGVYKKEMVLPVARVMREIGYQRAIVLHGGMDQSELGMDEASVCGETYCSELTRDGRIHDFTFRPEDVGIHPGQSHELRPDPDLNKEARRFVSLIQGRSNGARKKAALINAALIFYVTDQVKDIKGGVKMAEEMIDSGKAFQTLMNWVACQNPNPEKGLNQLNRLVKAI